MAVFKCVSCAIALSAVMAYEQTGSLTAAYTAGFMTGMSILINQGIGDVFLNCESCAGDFATDLNPWAFAGKVVVHGVASGALGYMQGDKFGHGFASAAVTQLFAPAIAEIDTGKIGVSLPRALAAAIVGGTASKAAGGKFANGAITGAFQQMFNADSHEKRELTLDDLNEQEDAVVNSAVKIGKFLSSSDYSDEEKAEFLNVPVSELSNAKKIIGVQLRDIIARAGYRKMDINIAKIPAKVQDLLVGRVTGAVGKVSKTFETAWNAWEMTQELMDANHDAETNLRGFVLCKGYGCKDYREIDW